MYLLMQNYLSISKYTAIFMMIKASFIGPNIYVYVLGCGCPFIYGKFKSAEIYETYKNIQTYYG